MVGICLLVNRTEKISKLETAELAKELFLETVKINVEGHPELTSNFQIA